MDSRARPRAPALRTHLATASLCPLRGVHHPQSAHLQQNVSAFSEEFWLWSCRMELTGKWKSEEHIPGRVLQRRGRRMCLILQPCVLHWGWFLCFLAPCFFSSLENDENCLLPWQHSAVVNSGSFVLYSEVMFCRGHLSKDFSFCSCHCLSHFH